VDHGFSEVIRKTKVFELHEKFFHLPFQATKCKLAGESELEKKKNFLADPACFHPYPSCIGLLV